MPFSTTPGLLWQVHKPLILHEKEEDLLLPVERPVQCGAFFKAGIQKARRDVAGKDHEQSDFGGDFGEHIFSEQPEQRQAGEE